MLRKKKKTTSLRRPWNGSYRHGGMKCACVVIFSQLNLTPLKPSDQTLSYVTLLDLHMLADLHKLDLVLKAINTHKDCSLHL